jgi:hypothetical protein
MDGFKKIVKMKTGGSVNKACGGMMMKKGGKCAEGGKVDVAQDKAIVKKAFNLHDKQKHENGKTDLSTLKKGGRSKKEVGTVKKYKAGGAIGMKKDCGDIADIKKIKATGVKKADAKSGAKAMPEKYKKGGKAKKCAHGGPIVASIDPQPIVDSRRYMADGGAVSDTEKALAKATKSTAAAQQAAKAAQLGMAPQGQGQGPYSDKEIDMTLADMAKRGDFSHTGD